MNNYVIYYRVSTQRQGKSGLGLEAQASAAATFTKDGTVLAEYRDIESGKTHTNRPGLQDAMQHCQRTGATLIIAKLDRLSRNAHFLAGLMESGIDFTACDMPVANKFTIRILAAVAEHERNIISQRAKDACAARFAREKKLGIVRKNNPPHGPGHGSKPRPPRPEEIKLMLDLHHGGTSYGEITRQLNALHITTPSGRKWTAQTTAYHLHRAGTEKITHTGWRQTLPASPEALAEIRRLHALDYQIKAIAERLNLANLASPAGKQWNYVNVRLQLERAGIPIRPRRFEPGDRHGNASTLLILRELRDQGTTLQRIADHANAQNLLTYYGKPWTWRSVRNALRRIQATTLHLVQRKEQPAA